MSAFIRIYTRYGKEHICTAEAYRLNYKPGNTVTFYDGTDCINNTIGAGQPCNVHIRYEDQDIETECILEGVSIQGNNIKYESSKINIITYKEIKQ